jgi:hypothetical protein
VRASFHTNLRTRKPATCLASPYVQGSSFVYSEAEQVRDEQIRGEQVRGSRLTGSVNNTSRTGWFGLWRQLKSGGSYCTTSVMGVVWEKVPDVAETVTV